MDKNLGTSAGLLALLTVAFHISSPNASEKIDRPQGQAYQPGPAKAKAGGQANTEGTHDEGPWMATRSFFHASGPEKVSRNDKTPVNFLHTSDIVGCSEEPECVKTLRKWFGLADDYTYEFVLATVPDPLHTRLALFTDASIQAIQNAAENAGWDFATQWLPWYDTVDPQEKDPRDRLDQRTLIREQEKQPGLLVFRYQPRQEDVSFPKRLLLVFIAGETPTAGINGAQFQIARAYTKAFCDPAVVRILGPTFSGSFFSLTQLVKDDHRQNTNRTYCVRTGTAANIRYARKFTNETGACFFGANENANDERAHFREVFTELHIPPEQAAILAEDESGLGRAFDPTEDRVPVFRFPREISQLRNAYREAVASSSSEKSAAPDVSFSLKDSESGEDSVPVFSRIQTPLSQNAVLGQITNEIRRSRIRIVQIVATNVLDTLFLTRVLRRQCPDTRVLIPFPDMLFVQAAQAEPLTGTLALSTYPLSFAGKNWTGGDRAYAASDTNSEGVYNATILLLARSESDIEAKDAELTQYVEDYSWKDGEKDVDHPPTWLLTLDRFGFSPLNVMTGTTPKWFEDVKSSVPDRQLAGPPRIWTLFVGLMAMFNVFLTAWIIYLHHYPRVQALALFEIDSGHAADSPRLFCLFLLLLVLTSMPAMLILPVPLHSFSGTRLPLIALAVAGIGAPLVLALWIAKTRLWPKSRRLPSRLALFKTPRDSSVRRFAAVIALIVFSAGIVLWTWCCYGQGDKGFFFRFRSLELHLGSSPAFPVLAALAALMVFSIVHLTRFHLAAYQRPRVYTSTFDSSLNGQLRRARRELNRLLLSPLNFRWRQQLAWTLAVFGVFALLSYLCRPNVILSSVDGSLYDLLCIGLQLSVILVLLLTCWQVKVCWRSFHSFLIKLNRLPVASAFTRLQNDGKSGPIWARRLDLKSVEIPVHCATALHDMRLVDSVQLDKIELKREHVTAWFTEYRERLRELFCETNLNEKREIKQPPLTKTRTVGRRDIRALRFTSARVADEICNQVLFPIWKQRPLNWAPVIDKSSKEHDAETTKSVETAPDPKDLYSLAQGFVALHLSTFIIYGMKQIQNLLLFLSAGFVLLVISMNSYSFQSPQLIGRFLLVTFVVLGYSTWRCMAQMERDPILSRLAGSTAGELNKDFYVRIIAYGAVPLLSILASQFPSVSNFLFSWVQPTLESLR